MPKSEGMNKPDNKTEAKTETKNTVENPFPWTLPAPEVFTQMLRDQIARTQGIMEELAVYENVAMQRARTAVHDLAKLATDSLGYMSQLSAEWRKLAVDAGRRAAETLGAKA
jgi:hypothetical protein